MTDETNDDNENDSFISLFKFREPFVNPQALEKTAKVVNQIFNSLFLICPAWQTMGGNTDDMKKLWVKALVNKNITNSEQIEFGLNKCLENGSAFFPTVGQFMEWCTDPECLNLPNIEKAYQEAIREAHHYANKNWSHPEILETVKRIGSFNFTHMGAKESRNIFEKTYREVISDILAGKKIPELPCKIQNENPINKIIPKKIETSFEDKNANENVSGAFEDMTPGELIANVTPEQKKNWKPGDTFAQYAHLNSRDKAIPVIMELLKKLEDKQKKAKKTLTGS